MKVIKIVKPDGTVATIYPVWKAKRDNETEYEFLVRLHEKSTKGNELEGLPYTIEEIQ